MSSRPKKTKGELCELLRTNFIQLVDEFNHIYKQDVLLCGLSAWFKDYNNEVDRGKKPYNEMMLKFIETVYPYKTQITGRDEDYFKNNVDKLFAGNLGHVISIKKYIFGVDSAGNSMLDDESKETIWEYFKVFIKLMDRYIELEPEACSKKTR